MTWLMETPVLLVLLSLAGAGLAQVLRQPPWLARGCCLLVLLLEAALLVYGPLDPPAQGLARCLAGLVLLASLVALLGGAPGAVGYGSPPALLIWTALGIGALYDPPVAQIGFAATSAAGLALLLWRTRRPVDPPVWPSLTLFTLAGLALLASSLAPPQMSVLLRLLASAIFLPLFPFHYGMGVVLRQAPGTLPALLIVVIPALGLNGGWTALTEAPEWIREAIGGLGLLTALAGILTALVQNALRRSLACGAYFYFGLIWWGLTRDMTRSDPTLLLFGGTILALAGLWIVVHQLEARYGDLSLRRPSGLALPMPRLAVLLTLLLTAALGLPGFAPFTGLMQVLASPGSRPAWHVAAVLGIWLLASWYWADLGQRLLFGPPHADRLHRDLGGLEALVLGVIILSLSVLSFITGAAPAAGPELPSYATTNGRPWTP